MKTPCEEGAAAASFVHANIERRTQRQLVR
jgi:hypothetical protein